MDMFAWLSNIYRWKIYLCMSGKHISNAFNSTDIFAVCHQGSIWSITIKHAQMWPWITKPALSCWGMFLAIAKNTLYGSKLYFFYFMTNIIRILSKDHVPWRYFVKYKLNLDNFCFIFFFLHPQIPDFQIFYLGQKLSDPNHSSNRKLIYLIIYIYIYIYIYICAFSFTFNYFSRPISLN